MILKFTRVLAVAELHFLQNLYQTRPKYIGSCVILVTEKKRKT